MGVALKRQRVCSLKKREKEREKEREEEKKKERKKKKKERKGGRKREREGRKEEKSSLSFRLPSLSESTLWLAFTLMLQVCSLGTVLFPDAAVVIRQFE